MHHNEYQLSQSVSIPTHVNAYTNLLKSSYGYLLTFQSEESPVSLVFPPKAVVHLEMKQT